MSVEQMRSAIRNAYSGQRWSDRVDKMSDQQVIAVYFRLLYKEQI